MGTTGLVPKIKDGDWVSVRQAIAKLSVKTGPVSEPTYAGLTLTGLTASRLTASDASKALESSDLASWVTQTANQVLVADDGDGTITLSTPQDIHTGASPTFTGLTLSGVTKLYGDVYTDRWLENITNTFIGVDVAGSDNLEHTTGDTGWYNTIIGNEASLTITSGSYNTAIGGFAINNITTGSANTAIGFGTLLLNNGNTNVALGYKAGSWQTAVSNYLFIDNQNRGSAANELTKSLIYGTFDADPANQTLKFNAAVTVSGAITATGIITGNDVIIGDARYIGSTSTPTAIQIEADGDVVLAGTLFIPNAFYHVGDGDTGLIFPNNNQFNMQAGGSEFLACNFAALPVGKIPNEVVINDIGVDIDFRVEGTGNANLLFTDGLNARVGIGGNAPSVLFSVFGVSRFGDDTTNYTQVSATGNITQVGTGRTLESEKYKLTAIGGVAIKLTNTTGAVTIAGQLVRADPATDDAATLTTADELEIIGVFLDSGIADDAEAWVVISGIADVAMEDNTLAAHGNWVRSSITEIGYSDATNAAAPQPINQTHFAEIGHCIETVAAGGVGTHILARCVLHFN